MKKVLVIASIVTTFAGSAQKHRVEKILQTDTVVAVPESVLPDLEHNMLYVLLINGAGWDANGKGSVARIGVDEKN